MYEKPYRSVLKTISWRTLGTIDTILISYFITGDVSMAASIGGIELFTKMVLYYLHERGWSRLNIGRVKVTEPEYNI